jgi:DNA-binding transcriptional MerR regulator
VSTEKLLTTAEAARAIGVSRVTLARYADRGWVEPTRVLPSGHRRWRLADLERQLRELRNTDRDNAE